MLFPNSPKTCTFGAPRRVASENNADESGERTTRLTRAGHGRCVTGWITLLMRRGKPVEGEAKLDAVRRFPRQVPRAKVDRWVESTENTPKLDSWSAGAGPDSAVGWVQGPGRGDEQP